MSTQVPPCTPPLSGSREGLGLPRPLWDLLKLIRGRIGALKLPGPGGGRTPGVEDQTAPPAPLTLALNSRSVLGQWLHPSPA